jgi:RNA polymerase sigma factor (sigma-70 family)
MAHDRYGSHGRQLHVLFSAGAVGRLTDAELLERFAGRGGEAAELAFAALVERHGPMVFRTCRQTLGDAHAAEDAFQATFLVLARRARTFRVRGSLAGWLHEVARRTASRLRAASARRRRHECKAARLAAAAVEARGCDDLDLGAALHEELGRLPARYRVPLVLCYLEGLTAEQAAREVGWPAGTVRSRLARGRERLRARLVRRGLAPSAAGVAAALAPRSAWSAVPGRLVDATARAAAGRFSAGAVPAPILTLTEGVLFDMAITKLKATGLAVLVAGVLASGALVSAQQGPGTGPPEKDQVRPESDRLQAVEAKLDRLLRAVERPGGAGGGGDAAPRGYFYPPGFPAPGGPVNMSPPGRADSQRAGGPDHAAPPVYVPVAPGGGRGQPGSAGLEQRVAELERRLAQVERQLAGSPDSRPARRFQPGQRPGAANSAPPDESGDTVPR